VIGIALGFITLIIHRFERTTMEDSSDILLLRLPSLLWLSLRGLR
jgi:hypothetical protein